MKNKNSKVLKIKSEIHKVKEAILTNDNEIKNLLTIAKKMPNSFSILSELENLEEKKMVLISEKKELEGEIDNVVSIDSSFDLIAKQLQQYAKEIITQDVETKRKILKHFVSRFTVNKPAREVTGYMYAIPFEKEMTRVIGMEAAGVEPASESA